MNITTKLGISPINIMGKSVKYDGIKIGKIIEVNNPVQGWVTVKIKPKYCQLLQELIMNKLVKTRIDKDKLLFYSEKVYPKIKEE